MKTSHLYFSVFGILLLTCLFQASCTTPEFNGEFSLIGETTGIKGGLLVHLGCGDGQKTALLHQGPQYIVHGFDRNEDNITKARRVLGYEPSIELEEGLKRTAEWYRDWGWL